jgi:hypothetical protein
VIWLTIQDACGIRDLAKRMIGNNPGGRAASFPAMKRWKRNFCYFGL